MLLSPGNGCVDIDKAIRDLYKEKMHLDKIIETLEEIERRAAASPDPATGAHKRGRKSMDARARQEVSERMKKYWAMRRNKPPQTYQ